MIAKTLPTLTLLALAACGGKKTPITATPEALKLRKDSFIAALSKQLETINYRNEIRYDGAQVTIRLSQDKAKAARQAICQEGGWPTVEGRKVRLDHIIRRLRESGFTKITITGAGETETVEVGQDGSCVKPQ
jgi:hypothetical protein